MSLDIEHYIGLNTIPQAALFHPEGQRYITSSGANLVIGDLTDPHSQEFLRGHNDLITVVALSRSGRLIASGQRGNSSDVLVWDYEKRQVLFKFEEHDHKIEALAFSEDEKILASLGSPEDGNLILWDMSNGCIITSAAKLRNGTCCLTFAGFVKDLKRRDTSHYQFITGGKEGIVVWDLDPYTGELHSQPVLADARATITRTITALTLTPDYETLFAATTSGDFLIVAMKQNRIIRSVLATRMTLHSILFHDDTNSIFLGCGDGTIKAYTAQGEMVQQVKVEEGSGVLCLSPSLDKHEALAATTLGTILRVNLRTLQYLVISEAHTGAVVQVAFDVGNSNRFASASADGTIKVWDLGEYAVTATCHARREQEPGATPLCLAFADLLFSGWSDGRVLAHNAETGESLWMLVDAHIGGVTAIVLSHNRRFILTGGPQGEVRLWELRTRELVSHLKEHKQKVTALALLREDTIALSGSRDRCILTWDLRSEKRTTCDMQRMGGVNGFVLCGGEDKESLIASVGQDKRIVLWRRGSTSPDPAYARYIDDEKEEGLCIAVSNCGRFLVTGGSQGVLRLWALQPWPSIGLILLQTVIAHSQPVRAVAFSLGDKQVVSVGEDGGIYLFWFFNDDEQQNGA